MATIVAIALLLTSLAGIVTSVILLWNKVVKPMYRAVKQIGVLANLLSGLPDWCQKVDTTLDELRPQYGSSVKDEVSEIKAMLEDHIKSSSNN